MFKKLRILLLFEVKCTLKNSYKSLSIINYTNLLANENTTQKLYKRPNMMYWLELNGQNGKC